MRRVTLLRHAKTQPDAPRGDLARRLTPEGEQAAAAHAPWIAKLGLETVLVSPAVRTEQTAERALAASEVNDVRFMPELYGASAHELRKILDGIESDNLLIVGHNPGIENLAEAMGGAAWCEETGGHMHPGDAVVLSGQTSDSVWRVEAIHKARR